MGPQDMPDEMLQRKAAANALRLDRDISREQQVAQTGQLQPPGALEPALSALRRLTEILEKESESR